MSALDTLRRHRGRLARLTTGLFVLGWLAIVAAPCAMAAHAADEHHGHACPKCPPAPPCHEASTSGCDHGEALDATRAADPLKAPLAVLPAGSVAAPVFPRARSRPPRHAGAPPRAGPRLHLLHAHFNE